jgi:acyl-CoA synthetase (NDP forming)
MAEQRVEPLPETALPSAPSAAVELLAPLVAQARAEGREHLLEREGLALAGALGLGVPLSRLVAGSRDPGAADLSGFPGERVVVKVVSSRILHKTEVGGVAVVAREPGAVAAALRAMEDRFAVEEVAGYSLDEYVPHDESPGGQLLLGLRWTDDFGPVVTLGLGGVQAELLAANLRPGRDVAILSPDLGAPDQIAAALDGKLVTTLLTESLRGRQPRLSRAALVALLTRLLGFAAAALPQQLAELEFNPVVLTPRGPVALDALARLGRGADPAPADPPRPIAKIRHLLQPAAVAVIGVSERQVNPGRIILRNMLLEGFDPARLFVVKPGGATIDGCRSVPSLASLDEPVDLAVLAIDAAQVPAAVEEILATRKAESLIVIPGGLGETGGSAGVVERLRSALAAARSTPWQGPVVNGGNCLGVRSAPGRVNTLFLPEAKLRFPPGEASPVALLSQSGAFAAARASGWAPLNPRFVISYGNQLDLTVGDYLCFLEGDPRVEVVACYVEGFRPLDGRRFVAAAARLAAAGRAVVLYRAGRTAAGARATASHTASVAGDWAVTRELARVAGVLVAETLEDFDDLVRLACLLRGKTVGRRLGALSNAGFECVALADALGGLALAPFGTATAGRLQALFASRRLERILEVHNPLDLSPMLDDEGYEEALQAVLDDPGVDVGLVGCVPLTAALTTLPPGPGHGEDLARPGAVADRLACLFRAGAKAWVAVVDGGALYDPLARHLAEEGVPVFRTADRAVRAFGQYCAWRLQPRRSVPVA